MENLRALNQMTSLEDSYNSEPKPKKEEEKKPIYDPILLKKDRDSYNNWKHESHEFDCPICFNKRWIMIDNGYNGIKPCQCMSLIKASNYAKNSGLMEEFKRFNFDSWKQNKPFRKEMFSLAKKYIDNYKNSNEWFFVAGSWGAGKTHLSVATLQELIRNGNKGLYKKWNQVTAELKQDINSKEALKIMYELSTCDLLYIDDFLKNQTKSDLGIAFRIIQERHDRNLKTIISSEHYLSEINDMDPAIGSRIRERAKNYTINIERSEDKNYRLEGNNG